MRATPLADVYQFRGRQPQRGCGCEAHGWRNSPTLGKGTQSIPTPTGLRPAWINDDKKEEGMAVRQCGEYMTRNALPFARYHRSVALSRCIVFTRCCPQPPLGVERTRRQPWAGAPSGRELLSAIVPGAALRWPPAIYSCPFGAFTVPSSNGQTPEGSRTRQPWAERCNPVGVGGRTRCIPRVGFANPGLTVETPLGFLETLESIRSAHGVICRARSDSLGGGFRFASKIS